MPNTFSGLANDIFTTEFASNTGIITFSQISGWFSTNVGTLNNLLNTSFSGVDPEIDNEASSVFKSMYMASYYDRETRNALRGITSAGGNLLSVAEGDSRVTFANKNEVAKTFRGLANDYKADIETQAYKYCLYMSNPRSIGGIDTDVTGYGYVGFQSLY